MTAEAVAPLRIAPGVVSTKTAPVCLGVRPHYRNDSDGKAQLIENVWEALIDDKDGEPKVILTMGPKVIRFIERYCVFTQARWAGVPFDLLPWQKSLLIEMFEVLWDGDQERYVRRYHEALLGTPKKNGKSDLLAAVGMYFLVADGEPSPVVVAAAANEISAKLVFNPAKTMVEQSHGAREPNGLIELCDAWDTSIFVRGEINAELRKVPASPKATEGLNLFVNLMDEWHEWTHPAATQTATKLQNGNVLRPGYFNIRTTTAGHDLESMCGEDYEFGQTVALGETDAPEWFFRWYEAPREVEKDGRVVPLDWRSREAVELANPSFGALGQWSFYENKLRRAKEAIYRRYYLNQWTETEDAWLPTGAWEGCGDHRFELVMGAPCAIGWDAATKHDSTALVIAQKRMVLDENNQLVERYVLRARIWERPFDPETRKPKEDWLLPIHEVKAQLLAWVAEYGPSSVEYDPTFITWEAASLSDAGYPMREFSQSSIQKMAQAAQGFYERVITGRVAHDQRDQVFTRHIKSAVARQTNSGSAAWLLTKGKAKKKMDACVAAAMAIWGLDNPVEKAGPVKAHAF